MLKKIFLKIMPASLKNYLREKDPYFRLSKDLQNERDSAVLQIRKMDQQLVQFTTICQDKDKKIDDANQKIREMDRQLTLFATVCQDKDRKIDDANQKIRELDRQLSLFITEGQDKDRKIDDANQKIREMNRQLAQFTTTCQDKDRKIDDANQKIREMDRQLSLFITEGQDKDRKIDDANQKIREMDRQLSLFITEGQDKDRKIDDANQKIREMDRQLSQFTIICQDKDRKIDDANQKIREMDLQISKVTADYSTRFSAIQQEKDLCNAQLQSRERDIQSVTEKFRKEKEILEKKLIANYNDYRSSLKQVLQNPSIREDHFCGICGNLMQFSFSKKVMNKYDVSYFSCSRCKHVQTEKPYWLEEAYKSPLSDSDTGQIWRNEQTRNIVCAVVRRFMKPSPKILEYAGGYGLLTRMLRDDGLECYWYDKYAQNTFARHFEDDGNQQYDLTLAFEALEHFEDPMQEFENIFRRSESLLFSEKLLQDLCPNEWWYLCLEHGQHINFYSMETLQYIADHFHRKLLFFNDIGLITGSDITQADFEEMLKHVEEYAKQFRSTSHPLTLEDMNTVIKEMKLS